MTSTCSVCGSTRIHVMDWIDANRDKIIGGSDSPGISDCWCDRCEENVRVDWITEDVRANARALRLAGEITCPFGCPKLHVSYNQANECPCPEPYNDPERDAHG